VVGAFTLVSEKYKGLIQLLEFTTSLFVSFVARVVTSYIPDTCYFANLLSSLVWFFPGLSITLSVAEVSAQSLGQLGHSHIHQCFHSYSNQITLMCCCFAVSGSARFFYAVVTSLQIGFGMALGGGLASWDGKSPSNSCTKATESGDWVTAIFFVVCTLTFNILLSASCKQVTIAVGSLTLAHSSSSNHISLCLQWLPMSLSSGIGFAVATLLASPLGEYVTLSFDFSLC
jgi:hypothetical protein